MDFQVLNQKIIQNEQLGPLLVIINEMLKIHFDFIYWLSQMHHCLLDLSAFYPDLYSMITMMDQQFQIMIPSFELLTRLPFIVIFSFFSFFFSLSHYHPYLHHLDFLLYPILNYQNKQQTHSIYQIAKQYNHKTTYLLNIITL